MIDWKLITKWLTIIVKQINENDYFSLTDIAKFKNSEFPADVIKNWIRNKNTIDFLGVWEILYNPKFNMVEFDQFKNQAWYNSFVLSPQKWIEKTNAIWLINKSWRYWWWTFAHKDIALEFASRISVEFKLYIVKDFQRLKENEQKKHSKERDVTRILSKINYKIHNDAILNKLIPKVINPEEISIIYASEADIINKVLFGQTANERRINNKNMKWNIRDYATIEQLVVLSNIEVINALFIEKWLSQKERIIELNKIAISQMNSLINNKSLKKLEYKSKNFIN